MVKTLHLLGLISIVGGIILGLIFGVDNGFRLIVALSWWIMGLQIIQKGLLCPFKQNRSPSLVISAKV